MKVLVAVDGSPYTKRMLGYLAAHEEWLGAAHRYTVVHATAPLPSRAAQALERSQIDEFHQTSSEKVFKPIRTFFDRQGIVASFVAKVGEPADVIARMADSQKFDLLIMGSHGHGRLATLVLGSVATRVLASCKVPVLLIR
jgi:nucleotide-binding universal stress UspA family protein